MDRLRGPTLAKLMARFYDPSKGSVRLDGVEVSDWNHDELGPHEVIVTGLAAPGQLASFVGVTA